MAEFDGNTTGFEGAELNEIMKQLKSNTQVQMMLNVDEIT